MASFSAGAPPRYGTCTNFVPLMKAIGSSENCWIEATPGVAYEIVFGFAFAASTSDLMSEGGKFGLATIASGEDPRG